MTLHRLLPRDQAGAPRRLRGHGEAMRWAFVSLGRLGIRALPAYVFAMIGQFAVRFYFGSQDLTLLSVTIAFALPLAFWLLSSPLLYLYTALSGGVMSRDERRRNFPGR